MLELLDGPCKTDLLVHRAPLYLRAVIGRKGVIDVLDQVEDTPKKTEKIYVYKREEGWVDIHISMTPRSHSGFYVIAKYHYLPDVDGESLRDNEEWQKWAFAQMQPKKADKKKGAGR